ncbi:hypothetical protein QR680_007332 [Steinernema hermaphroditum]|uniref:Nematode cuticle collagen N-terminal domain-containing protein n=1 Tax=Steinernema hermaphroditum TaxID=289476 RepID=A0AA39ICV3_9BILA|nr:hypothetical protein QR680_007332 [Steinernema hermaphroditum]
MAVYVNLLVALFMQFLYRTVSGDAVDEGIDRFINSALDSFDSTLLDIKPKISEFAKELSKALTEEWQQ